MEIIMSQHVLNDSSQSSSSTSLGAPSASFATSSTTPLVPSPADFNALASILQDIAQVLLKYGIPELHVNADTGADTNSDADANSDADVKATVTDAEKPSQKEAPPQSKQLGDLGSLEKSSSKEQPEHIGKLEQPNSKEQVITFCYNTEEKRTPAFLKMYGDIIEQHRRGEFNEEIRCFHLSASNVRKEYELLNKHNCVNLSEFLDQTYNELSMVINLLSYVDRNIDLPANELQQACYNMLNSLENLRELHTHMENSQLVHATIIPA